MAHYRHKPGFFSRRDIVRIFGVHMTTVRRWEKRKKDPLPWVLDANGVHRFPRAEILARAEKAGSVGGIAGSLTWQLFELFAEGMDWRQAASKSKMHPAQAEALFEIYWADDPERNERLAVERAKEEQAAAKPKAPQATPRPREVPVPAPEPTDWAQYFNEATRLTREQNEREQREWEERRAREASSVSLTPAHARRLTVPPTLPSVNRALLATMLGHRRSG